LKPDKARREKNERERETEELRRRSLKGRTETLTRLACSDRDPD